MNRPLITLIGGMLLLLVAAAGGIVWLSPRPGSLGDRLVSEANARAQATWPRPSHVGSPTPGSFGQALEPLVPELLRLHKSSDYDVLVKDRACRALEEGSGPYESLPAPWLSRELAMDSGLRGPILSSTSPTEAHLKPRDAALAEYALRLTADTPP